MKKGSLNIKRWFTDVEKCQLVCWVIDKQVKCFYFYLGLKNFGIFESGIYLNLTFLFNIIYLTFLFNLLLSVFFFKKFKNNAAELEIWFFLGQIPAPTLPTMLHLQIFSPR